MLAIMEAFFYLPLMLRHVKEEGGREEIAREGCCFLGNRHSAAQGTGGICLKDCLKKQENMKQSLEFLW